MSVSILSVAFDVSARRRLPFDPRLPSVRRTLGLTPREDNKHEVFGRSLKTWLMSAFILHIRKGKVLALSPDFDKYLQDDLSYADEMFFFNFNIPNTQNRSYFLNISGITI